MIMMLMMTSIYQTLSCVFNRGNQWTMGEHRQSYYLKNLFIAYEGTIFAKYLSTRSDLPMVDLL